MYSVQGYDAGQLLAIGAKAVNGDLNARPALYKAREPGRDRQPARGKGTMSKAHYPVQDFDLRRVENGENKVIGVAAKALPDAGAGCKLGGRLLFKKKLPAQMAVGPKADLA